MDYGSASNLCFKLLSVCRSEIPTIRIRQFPAINRNTRSSVETGLISSKFPETDHSIKWLGYLYSNLYEPDCFRRKYFKIIISFILRLLKIYFNIDYWYGKSLIELYHKQFLLRSSRTRILVIKNTFGAAHSISKQ